MNPVSRFDLSWQTLWRLSIWGLIIYFLYLAKESIALLLVAIVISLGLDPIVSFLETKKINRLLGAVFIFLLAILVLTTIIYFVAPIIIVEISGFIEHFNKTILTIFGIGLPKEAIKDLSLSLDSALNFFTATNISITGAIGAVMNKVIFFLATIVISFYLSLEKEGTNRFLKAVLPDIYERPVLTIFDKFKLKIRYWLTAQLALSLTVGLLVGLGLWLLDVRYALIIGVLAAVFEIVPIVGPVLTAFVAFLVAVADSFSLGLYTLLFLFIIQQIENHILFPVVMEKAMKVHPVIVIFSLIAGSQIAGFVGVILAVPIAVMIQEIFNYLMERKSRRIGLGV